MAVLDLAGADAAIRGELIAAVDVLHRAQVLPYSGMSNGSVRLSGDEGILFSSGGLAADIGVEDFAVVDLAGGVVEGVLGPFDGFAVGFHLEVYRAHPEVDTVLHTHSTAATSFALAGRPLPLHYEPLLFLGQRQDIPVTRYGNRNAGTSLSDEVAATLAAHPDTKAVLLANHGLVVWGAGPVVTAEFLIVVEEAAAIIGAAAAHGGSQPFPIS